MIKKLLIPLSFFSFTVFCQEQKSNTSLYPSSIGNIEFDSNLDKKDFQLCFPNYNFQYFNDSNGLLFLGDKIAIEKEFREKYKSENYKKESGLIRIRFIVNCKGETDRFRIIGMDENYQEKMFNESITQQLLQISKGLKGWKVKKSRNYDVDYYQYLIFKIKDGQIIEILP